MRQIMNLVEAIDDTMAFFLLVHRETPLRRPLRESRRPTPVMEGSLSKKIAATTQRVVAKYGRVDHDAFARFTHKALDVYRGDQRVIPVVQKIHAIGRESGEDHAILAALSGMVGVLIGLSTDPASAGRAAKQIDLALTGPLDEVAQRLQRSGIPVGATDLPPGLVAKADEVVGAFKAIQAFEFSRDHLTDVTRDLSSHLSIEADVVHENPRMSQDILVKTQDGLIPIARIRAMVEDGRVVEDEASGVSLELHQLGDLSPRERHALDRYLSSHVTTPNGEGVVAMLKVKSADLALLIATLARNPHSSHVSIGAGATEVRESVQLDEEGLTNKERKEFNRLQNRLRDGTATREEYQAFFLLKKKRKPSGG